MVAAVSSALAQLMPCNAVVSLEKSRCSTSTKTWQQPRLGFDARQSKHRRPEAHIRIVRSHPRQRYHLHHRRLRRKPDESRLDLINRNTDLFLFRFWIRSKLLESRSPRLHRGLQSSRHPDLCRGPTTFPSCNSSSWIGNTARYHPLLQLDRRPSEVSADADSSSHSWRTRRQHGTDLVECHGGWSVAGKVSRLERASCQRHLHSHQRLGSRVPFEERWSWIRRRYRHPRRDPLGHSRSAENPAGSTVQDGACYGTAIRLIGSHDGWENRATARIEMDLWPKEIQGQRASGAALKPTLDAVLKRIGG